MKSTDRRNSRSPSCYCRFRDDNLIGRQIFPRQRVVDRTRVKVVRSFPNPSSLKNVLIVSTSNPPPITLDQFLKQSGVVGSGGQAKILIQAGEVLLNGTVETRRGKKLAPGDIVTVGDERLRVPAE